MHSDPQKHKRFLRESALQRLHTDLEGMWADLTATDITKEAFET